MGESQMGINIPLKQDIQMQWLVANNGKDNYHILVKDAFGSPITKIKPFSGAVFKPERRWWKKLFSNWRIYKYE